MSDDNIQKPSSKITTENKLGFRVTSGVTLTDGELKNEVTDYTMFTDEGQGIAWYKNGLHRLVTNGCSYETVGVGKRGEQKENQPAKIICASTGNIIIEAIVSGLPSVVTESVGFSSEVLKRQSGEVLKGDFNQDNFNLLVADTLADEKLSVIKESIHNLSNCDYFFSRFKYIADYIENEF